MALEFELPLLKLAQWPPHHIRVRASWQFKIDRLLKLFLLKPFQCLRLPELQLRSLLFVTGKGPEIHGVAQLVEAEQRFFLSELIPQRWPIKIRRFAFLRHGCGAKGPAGKHRDDGPGCSAHGCIHDGAHSRPPVRHRVTPYVLAPPGPD